MKILYLKIAAWQSTDYYSVGTEKIGLQLMREISRQISI